MPELLELSGNNKNVDDFVILYFPHPRACLARRFSFSDTYLGVLFLESSPTVPAGGGKEESDNITRLE
jgi:hypothetical protein